MSASIDLVTSHKGTAHITTQNVVDLIGGLSGNISGIKVFPDLYNGLNHEIIDTLTVRIKTGAALADGFFFLLTEAFDWVLDPGTVGYSRIDILFLVMYEDPDTNVQTADLVYEVGTDYPNGTTGTEPSAPTGTSIINALPLVRVDMSDGAIVSVTDYGTPYLSNSDLSQSVASLVEELEESIGSTVSQVTANTNALNGFRFGIDSNGKYGYYKAGADSVTPFRQAEGNAVQADVLYGKTFSNANADNIAGTMANQGAWNGTGTPSGNNQVDVIIPAGYHNGSGKVTCKGQTAYAAGDSAGFARGRAQGRADQSSHTIYLYESTGTYNDEIYIDNVKVWEGSFPFRPHITINSSYNGVVFVSIT